MSLQIKITPLSMSTFSKALGVVFLSAACVACSSTKESMVDANSSSHHGEMHAHHTEPAVAAKDKSEMEALFWARKDSAKMNFVQADVDFMQGMIGHHAQALVMSALAPKNGAGPEVSKLASRIINAQKDEIGLMQRWLSDRGLAVPQVYIDGLNLTTKMGEEPHLEFYPDGKEMAMMTSEEHIKNHAEHMANGMHEQHQKEKNNESSEHDMSHESHDMTGEGMSEMNHEGHEMGDTEKSEMDHGDHDMGNMDTMEHEGGMMHDHSTMPGMLSQAQLEELAATKGSAFDKLFLQYMIQHHSGAITMVNTLLEADGAMEELEIGKLAGDINVDQKTEIERMRLLLVNMVANSSK